MDGECAGGTNFSVYHPTAVTTDGSASYTIVELGPGKHSHDASWNADHVLGGTFAMHIDTLFVYPG